MYYQKYIKTSLLINNMHCKGFIWTTLKAIFSIFKFFVSSDSIFSNSCFGQILSYHNKPYISGKLIYSTFRSARCINLFFLKTLIYQDQLYWSGQSPFTFMHLADAFIQSDLHCIQVTVSTFYQLLLSLGIEPMILALLTQCSTSWATGKLMFS